MNVDGISLKKQKTTFFVVNQRGVMQSIFST